MGTFVVWGWQTCLPRAIAAPISCSRMPVHVRLFGTRFVLVEPPRKLTPVNMFVAQLMLHDLGGRLFCAGYNAVLHVHTAEEEVKVEAILSEFKKGKESTRRPKFVRGGAICTVALSVPRKLTMTTYEEMAQLGRFTLRDEGRTIGIGKVLSLGDPRKQKGTKKVKKAKSKKDKKK